MWVWEFYPYITAWRNNPLVGDPPPNGSHCVLIHLGNLGGPNIISTEYWWSQCPNLVFGGLKGIRWPIGPQNKWLYLIVGWVEVTVWPPGPPPERPPPRDRGGVVFWRGGWSNRASTKPLFFRVVWCVFESSKMYKKGVFEKKIKVGGVSLPPHIFNGIVLRRTYSFCEQQCYEILNDDSLSIFCQHLCKEHKISGFVTQNQC